MSDSQGFPPPPPPPPLPLPPIGTGGRVAPPWEREGPAVQRYVDTAKSVLTQPKDFFRLMRREGGLQQPLIYAIIGIAIGSFGAYLISAMMPFGSIGMMRGGGFIASVIMLPIVATIALFVGGGILHVLLTLIARTRQPFETTFRVMAYTYGSIWPITIIPFLGGIVAAVWGLVIMVVGSSEAHEVPQGQAAIAVLLPSVICCGLAFLVGGALMALIFGAAAAGMAR